MRWTKSPVNKHWLERSPPSRKRCRHTEIKIIALRYLLNLGVLGFLQAHLLQKYSSVSTPESTLACIRRSCTVHRSHIKYYAQSSNEADCPQFIPTLLNLVRRACAGIPGKRRDLLPLFQDSYLIESMQQRLIVTCVSIFAHCFPQSSYRVLGELCLFDF